MHSRIKKNNDNFEKGKVEVIPIEEYDPEYENNSRKRKGPFAHKMTEAEIKKLHGIFTRHKNIMKDDVFGRNDVFSSNIMFVRNQKKEWPTLPAIAISQQTDIDYQKTAYQRMGDALIKEYMLRMVESNIFISPKTLDKLPFIDITGLFGNPRPKNTTTPLQVIFDEQELHDIRQYGWKVFLPYFDEQFIKLNKNRYMYIKLISLNKKERTFTIHCETYIGDINVWLCTARADIQFSFGQSDDYGQTPAIIDVNNCNVYEQLVSDGIHLMKWNKQQITLWTDMFACPSDSKDIIMLKLKRPEELKDEKTSEEDESIMYVYGSGERNLLIKALGSNCHVVPYKEAEEEYKAMIRRSMVANYMNVMGTLFFQFNQESEITEKNGKSLQKFDEVIVRSEKPVKRRTE